MGSFFILYLACGTIIGFFSGFFGIGGGIIGIPALLFIFEHEGMSNDLSMHMAIGTSLAIVVITSSATFFFHYRRRNMILFDVLKKIILGIVVGSALGVLISNYLHSIYLKRIFGVLVLWISIQTLLNVRVQTPRQLPKTPFFISTTSFLAALSSMLGIGGSGLLTPYLYWCGIPIRQAIATATVCIIPTALVGTVGYLFSSPPLHTTLPHWGYIYWPAFVGISITSVLTSPLGVQLSHVVSSHLLTKFFAGFLGIVGVLMLVA